MREEYLICLQRPGTKQGLDPTSWAPLRHFQGAAEPRMAGKESKTFPFPTAKVGPSSVEMEGVNLYPVPWPRWAGLPQCDFGIPLHGIVRTDSNGCWGPAGVILCT